MFHVHRRFDTVMTSNPPQINYRVKILIKIKESYLEILITILMFTQIDKGSTITNMIPKNKIDSQYMISVSTKTV